MTPPDFNPSACRAALDATEGAGVPPEVVAMLRRLVDREESPWISVEQALPIESMTCLVYQPGSCRVSTWMKRSREWLCDTDTAAHRFYPTHWTPIPIPPPEPYYPNDAIHPTLEGMERTHRAHATIVNAMIANGLFSDQRTDPR